MLWSAGNCLVLKAEFDELHPDERERIQDAIGGASRVVEIDRVDTFAATDSFDRYETINR